MKDIESSAQLLTDLFELSRESVQIAHHHGGAYNCREVTGLDRLVYHSVITADHNILGPLRVQLTYGEQKLPNTSDQSSIYPKLITEKVLLSNTRIPFFMCALRPQPREVHPRIYLNPTIFVACAQDGLTGASQPVFSSFWEVLDQESGEKDTGDLGKLGFSSKDLFLVQDRAIINSFVSFAQTIPEWGSSGTLRRIQPRLSNMQIAELSQYDLYAGTRSKVTYPSVPEAFRELGASPVSDIAS